MRQKKNQKAIYVISFLLLVVGIGYLVVSGINKNSVYFLNVSEALAKDAESIKNAKVFGKVLAQDLEEKEDSLGVKFWLADKEDQAQTIRIDYAGAVPDSFKPGIEVIVQGSMHKTSSVFEAQSLMTKCPSKYKKQ